MEGIAKMLRMFHPDHLPIIGEFVITGMVYIMAISLNSNNEVDEFIDTVKSRCISQGMDETKIRGALEPLNNAIKLAMKEYIAENNGSKE